MPTFKKPTLDDVALEAGVSKSSVSMILNEKEGVSFSEETIEKVLQAATTVGYVKKKKKFSQSEFFKYKTLLILTPSVTSPYYSSLIQSIETEAEEKNLRVIIQNTYQLEEVEREAIQQIKGTNIYGIIAIISAQNMSLLEELNKTIPVVVINDLGIEYSLDTLEINQYDAGEKIAQHMISLGHKHVAFLAPSLSSYPSGRSKRLKAVQDTYKELVPEGSVTVTTANLKTLDELENITLMHKIGYDLTPEILRQERITGIIAANDLIAYGIMDALLEMKYRIPEDYSVCGFDNLFYSGLKSISLTSMEHQLNSKGLSAIGIILSRYEEDTRHLSNIKLVVKHDLIARNSTGEARTHETIEGKSFLL